MIEQVHRQAAAAETYESIVFTGIKGNVLTSQSIDYDDEDTESATPIDEQIDK